MRHTAHRGYTNACKSYFEYLKVQHHVGDRSVDGRIILKCNLSML